MKYRASGGVGAFAVKLVNHGQAVEVPVLWGILDALQIDSNLLKLLSVGDWVGSGGR